MSAGTIEQRQMVEPLGEGLFTGDGRGPELARMVWSLDGRKLRAIEYRHAVDGSVCHAAISGVQAVMITPDEVVGGSPAGNVSVGNVRSYATKLGSSTWLASLNTTHLSRCAHYRLEFYDEVVDIICEGVEFRRGGWTGKEA